MMRFEDFDIPVRTEPFGRHPCERLQQIDADREISGLHDGKRLGGLGDLGLFIFREPRRADDGGADTGMFQRIERGERGGGPGEIDPDIGLAGGGDGIGGGFQVQQAAAGQFANIVAQMLGGGGFAAAGHGEASVQRRADQLAAHAAGDSGNGHAERIGMCRICHARRYSGDFRQGERRLRAWNKFMVMCVPNT